MSAAAFALVAAVVVLKGARDRTIAWPLAFLAVVGAGWSTTFGLHYLPGFAVLYPNSMSALRCFGLLMPAAVFLAAYALIGRPHPALRAMTIVGFVFAATLCVLNLMGLIAGGTISNGWGMVARPGPLYPLYLLFCLSWLSASLIVVAYALRAGCSPPIALRLKYLLVAAIPAVALGLMNFLPNYGVSVPPMGGLGVILFLGVMAYAAVRHRVMDIDGVLIRGVAPALSLSVVGLPVAIFAMWTHRSTLGEVDFVLYGSMVGIWLVSALCFPWVRDHLRRWIERSLFPARHRARLAIETFCHEVVELSQRETLGHKLTLTVTSGLAVTGTALYVREEASGNFHVESASGELAAPALLDSEVSKDMRGGLRDGGAAPAIELCVPIGSSSDALGFIALGPKRSGAAIEEHDLTLLRLVASQVAVAMRNLDYVRQIEAQRESIERQKAAIETQKNAIESQKAEIEELHRRLEAENTVLRAEVRTVSGFGEIIGASPALQRVLDVVDKAACSDVSILIGGETGTGKELVVRAIHERSARRAGPLISVNCPAIPHDLAEAELFGCERGAYTGANQARPGRFELADGGTLFLDEVADLSHAIQTKLLRVLQEREVQRLGGTRTLRIDVRILAATNRDLRQAIARGEFRADLYHRLAGIVAELPPLRERSGDIEMLATYFLDRSAKTHRKPIGSFSAGAIRALRSYNWPGNIRELQNVVERAVLLCGGEVIAAEHLGDLVVSGLEEADTLKAAVREEKMRRVEEALHAASGNIAGAARLLGMSRSNLSRLIKTLGIRRASLVQ